MRFFLVLVILAYLFCLTRTCLNILYMICLISFALIFLCHIFWQFPCIFLPYINTMPQEQDYNEWVKATFLSLEVKMLTAQLVSIFSSFKPAYHFKNTPVNNNPLPFMVMLQDFLQESYGISVTPVTFP